MAYNSNIGNAVFALGIVILLFTFYEAYSLYTQMLSASTQPPAPISLNNTSANSVGAALADILPSTLPSKSLFYDLLAVFVLFVFGSIGYKVAKLGLEMKGLDKPQSTKQQK
ncbi:MAG: hypothetical protein ACP5MZ_01420 [Candidatus Micrarchaeia archaeon]